MKLDHERSFRRENASEHERQRQRAERRIGTRRADPR
jgi:hypothetical protein